MVLQGLQHVCKVNGYLKECYLRMRKGKKAGKVRMAADFFDFYKQAPKGLYATDRRRGYCLSCLSRSASSLYVQGFVRIILPFIIFIFSIIISKSEDCLLHNQFTVSADILC